MEQNKQTLEQAITTRLHNKPDVLIRELLTRVNELEGKLQRAHWKTRNQRNEIKRLNRAMIERNHLVNKWSHEVSKVRLTDTVNTHHVETN